jgi:hypothetical protein
VCQTACVIGSKTHLKVSALLHQLVALCCMLEFVID